MTFTGAPDGRPQLPAERVRRAQVVGIGGGQAGLAAGYYLRRAEVDFVVLEAEDGAGGAWRNMWDSLHLFSHAAYSSLPGRMMPAQQGEMYPDAAHVTAYLGDYEQRYRLPVIRPARVHAVDRHDGLLRVSSTAGTWLADAVISATGTWERPFLLLSEGQDRPRLRHPHWRRAHRPRSRQRHHRAPRADHHPLIAPVTRCGSGPRRAGSRRRGPCGRLRTPGTAAASRAARS